MGAWAGSHSEEGLLGWEMGEWSLEGQTHGGTCFRCVADHTMERAWILAWVPLRGDSKSSGLCPAQLINASLAVLKAAIASLPEKNSLIQ